MTQLRDYLNRISSLEAEVERFKEENEALRAIASPAPTDFKYLHGILSYSEGILCDLLRRSTGIVTKNSLYTALYWSRPDGPQAKTIDVFVCKVRTKLARNKFPGEVITSWGRGYMLSDELRSFLNQRIKALNDADARTTADSPSGQVVRAVDTDLGAGRERQDNDPGVDREIPPIHADSVSRL